MDELKDLINQEGQWIQIVLGKEIITDPEEDSKKVIFNNPIPIKALVNSISPEKLTWKFFGVSISEAKELIIDAKYENLIKKSQKILIDNVEYVAYLSVGQLTIQNLGSYLRVTVVRK